MKSFFTSLSKSTKITLISCLCFILLTMLILTFLMLCPVKLSSSANHANEALLVTESYTESAVTAVPEETNITARTKRTTDKRKTGTTTRTTTANIKNEDAEPDYYEPENDSDQNNSWGNQSYPTVVQTKPANLDTGSSVQDELDQPPVDSSIPDSSSDLDDSSMSIPDSSSDSEEAGEE